MPTEVHPNSEHRRDTYLLVADDRHPAVKHSNILGRVATAVLLLADSQKLESLFIRPWMLDFLDDNSQAVSNKAHTKCGVQRESTYRIERVLFLQTLCLCHSLSLLGGSAA